MILLLSILLLHQTVLSQDEPNNRVRRDIFDNIAKDDPTSPCRNGGMYQNGQCHCIYPHTGRKCQEFQCKHGISVGIRFQPKSLLFNKPCICEKGYTGDLCEYDPSEKCNNHGEWKDSRYCECFGYYFGPYCQFNSRCIMGSLIRGICVCKDDWEGEYCDQIRCHHGMADDRNKSMSCICSKRYTGTHCDTCRPMNYTVSPYPECEEVKKPFWKAKPPPKKEVDNRLSRIMVMCGAGGTLFLFLALMFGCSYRYHKSKLAQARREDHKAEMNARKQLLHDAAIEPEPELVLEPEPEQSSGFTRSWKNFRLSARRKSSITNLFRFRNPSAPQSGQTIPPPPLVLD